MEALLKKHAEKIKFVLVGGFNTVLDFTLLFIGVALGLDKIVANFISTGASMVVSFFANKSFTFNNSDRATKRQFILFIIITAFGLWVIQPIVILAITGAFSTMIINTSVLLFIAKVIATIASLIWNYLFYSRFVFKKEG